MNKITLGLLGTLFSTLAFAQTAPTPEFEAVCRIKAKEVAAESYRSCVTEARATHIDQLKKDYQEKLRTMKEDYERDLKRLSSGKANQTTSQATPATPAGKTPKSKKVAKTKSSKSLPSKTAVAAPAPVSEDMTLELKPSTSAAPMSDDSVLDIPEPTAIEDVPTASNN